MACVLVVGSFNAFGSRAVDYADDAATLLGFGDDDLDWVGGSTENIGNFGDVLDSAKHVDREAVSH